jgi:hypothetical protein
MNDAQRKIEPKVRVWPFVESPGELAARLHRALDDFDGDMIAAVRCVFIEEPAALLAQSTPPLGRGVPLPFDVSLQNDTGLPLNVRSEVSANGKGHVLIVSRAAPDSAAPLLVVADPSVPAGEVRFVQDGRTVGTIAAAQADAPTEPHEFVGRLDRRCEVCNRPDRHPIHAAQRDARL